MSVLIAFRNTECRTLIEVEEEKRRAKEELIKTRLRPESALMLAYRNIFHTHGLPTFQSSLHLKADFWPLLFRPNHYTNNSAFCHPRHRELLSRGKRTCGCSEAFLLLEVIAAAQRLSA
jgi:hypothetical protein